MTAADSLDFLFGGGEMGARIRAHDWAATPLGPPKHWPQSLRSALGICLNSSFPTAIYWGPDLRLLYNDAWAPIPAERHPWALGRSAQEIWSDIWDVIGPQFAEVMEQGRGLSSFDQMLAMVREGAPRETYWNYSFTPIRGETGAVAGVFNQGNETTERVLRDRRRAEEIERIRGLVERAPGFVAVLRGPDHVFEFVNRTYRTLFGDRGYLGCSVRQVFPDLSAQAIFDRLDQVYESGERFIAKRLAVAITPPGGVTTERFLDFIYEPLTDSAGRVAGIFCEGFDVTEGELAERALREQTHALETLNRVATTTLAETDPERIIQAVTDAGVALSGAAYGAFFYNVLKPDGLSYMLYALSGAERSVFEAFPNPRDTAVFAPTFRGEGVVRSDDILTDPRYGGLGGMPRGHLPVRSYLAVPVIARDGEVIGGLLFGHSEPGRFTDRHEGLMIGLAAQAAVAIENARLIQAEREANELLERRVAERTAELTEAHEALRQAQKMEAVGQLTGGIAHDFNNLLAGICGSLEIIERRLGQGRTDGLDRFIQGAQASAQRAAALTQRLLAFSRRQTLDPRPTDVNRLVTGMEELIARTVGPSITVVVEGEVGLWPTLVDAAQLESALLNLAINARDAMPDGGRLTIATANVWLDEREGRERDLPSGPYLSICVSDTGTGIAADIAHRIFDPFFTTKPIGQGTGLGLSMIHGFVRQSGGQVRAQSHEGAGTTMCLYLPRHQSEAAAGEDERARDLIGAGTGESVLVIDDEATVRMLIVEVLRETGYAAIEAEDGPSGLRVLESDARIDLLISDVGLPGGLNGRQVADAARRLRPGLKVLFVTGYAETAAVGNGLLEPGMGVITKPFAMADLAGKISEMLGR